MSSFKIFFRYSGLGNSYHQKTQFQPAWVQTSPVPAMPIRSIPEPSPPISRTISLPGYRPNSPPSSLAGSRPASPPPFQVGSRPVSQEDSQFRSRQSRIETASFPPTPMSRADAAFSAFRLYIRQPCQFRCHGNAHDPPAGDRSGQQTGFDSRSGPILDRGRYYISAGTLSI